MYAQNIPFKMSSSPSHIFFRMAVYSSLLRKMQEERLAAQEAAREEARRQAEEARREAELLAAKREEVGQVR